MRQAGVLVALMALFAAVHAQTFPEPRRLKINERVYVLLGPIQHANKLNQGYMINSTVIVGDNGVIVVDSGGSDEVGRHIATAVRRITDKPITHVVNTHTTAITTLETWRSREPRSLAPRCAARGFLKPVMNGSS